MRFLFLALAFSLGFSLFVTEVASPWLASVFSCL